MAKGLFLIFPAHGHINPTIGLVAKKPDRGMTTTGHVTSGSRNKESQFISTTLTYHIRKNMKNGSKNRRY